MKNHLTKSILATLGGGTVMWILAGLWHNLVLPFFNREIEPHHDGLLVMLAAYYILAGLMTYLYTQIKKESVIKGGLKTGILVGIMWVFPHGLVMAGIHDTSISYEFGNILWHVVEQGCGGLLIAFIQKEQ